MVLQALAPILPIIDRSARPSRPMLASDYSMLQLKSVSIYIAVLGLSETCFCQHTDISEMRTLHIMISGNRHKTIRFVYIVFFTCCLMHMRYTCNIGLDTSRYQTSMRSRLHLCMMCVHYKFPPVVVSKYSVMRQATIKKCVSQILRVTLSELDLCYRYRCTEVMPGRKCTKRDALTVANFVP